MGEPTPTYASGSPDTTPRSDADDEEPVEEATYDEYVYMIKRLNRIYPGDCITVPEGADVVQLRELYMRKVVEVQEREIATTARHTRERNALVRTHLADLLLSRMLSREGKGSVDDLSPLERYTRLVQNLNTLYSGEEVVVEDGPLKAYTGELLALVREGGPMVVPEGISADELKVLYDARIDELADRVMEHTRTMCTLL
jgi:hypothetical protein